MKRSWEQFAHDLLGRPELEFVRKEMNRITTEVAKLDLQKHLSPTARARLQKIDRKYNELVVNMHKLQKQIDGEFNWAVKKLKATRKNLQGTYDVVNKRVTVQKKNIKKLSADVSKRLKKLTAAKKTRTSKAKKKQ